jgi:hypothetical protein
MLRKILKSRYFVLFAVGRWPAHQSRIITTSYEKLCPVHRGLIAMSGRRAAHISILRCGRR